MLSCYFACSYSANIEQPLLKIGNFVLPVSQEPGPLINFGENIVDKGQTILYIFADDYSGIDKGQVDVIPSFLYGITDSLSVFFNVPAAAKFKQNQNHYSGLEDAFLQLEYAFYTKKTSTFMDKTTFVKKGLVD